jgi:[ribosomal protein S18]-alanine N-acetyltransferase
MTEIAALAPPTVRIAGIADAATMAELHASSFLRPWDTAAMASLLATPGVLALLAIETPDALARGLLIARLAADEAELLTLCVLPAHRRKGFAQALLAEAAGLLRARNAKTLFLEVEEGNRTALALYSRLGAVPVGERKRYYEHGADAAILSLAL